MSQPQQKVVQYLNEAHATEVGLVSVLQSQIAMTPRGSYRIGEADDERAKEVRSYERSHKNRTGVLKAAERELANA